MSNDERSAGIAQMRRGREELQQGIEALPEGSAFRIFLEEFLEEADTFIAVLEQLPVSEETPRVH